MTRTLRIRPEAEVELFAAADWYESRKPGLGADLVAAVDEALELILEAPLASPVWDPRLSHRIRVVRRFPYAVFFVVDHDDIDVVAIAHRKRTPGYWSER